MTRRLTHVPRIRERGGHTADGRPRRQVLCTLRDHGPQSRVVLARRLDLSPTTVTKVVGRLIDEGFVAESGVEGRGSRVGRPSTHVTLVPTAAYVLGVQVGVGTVHIGLCDLHGRPRHATRIPFDPAADPPSVLASLAAHANRLVKAAGVGPADILAAGVAAPGPVDRQRRRNLMALNLGWRDVAFSDHLEAALDVPTLVDHNVRAMALAEARHRRHQDADPLLYVYVRTGVGAGVVIDGEPFRPGAYGVSELGHVHVGGDERRCVCGASGCLETVVSEPRLAEWLTGVGDPVEPPLVRLAAGVERGDPRATTAADNLVEHLGTGLACAVNLLNPRLLVLGGMFDDAPDLIVDRVRTAVHRKAFPILRDNLRVDRSALGADAGVAGGAALALDKYFYA